MQRFKEETKAEKATKLLMYKTKLLKKISQRNLDTDQQELSDELTKAILDFKPKIKKKSE